MTEIKLTLSHEFIHWIKYPDLGSWVVALLPTACCTALDGNSRFIKRIRTKLTLHHFDSEWVVSTLVGSITRVVGPPVASSHSNFPVRCLRSDWAALSPSSLRTYILSGERELWQQQRAPFRMRSRRDPVCECVRGECVARAEAGDPASLPTPRPDSAAIRVIRA